MTQVVGNRIAAGLGSASATIALVFVLTYLSTWALLSGPIAVGDLGGRLLMMRNDFFEIRKALSDFSREHGRYPDSLGDLPEFKDYRRLDFWRHPYEYKKTGSGFELLSLGRDGKVGGIGLDSDIDSDPLSNVCIEPTFSQFLFESAGSGALFRVALVTSLCAGLACWYAGCPREQPLAARGRWLWTIAVTTAAAVAISFLVMAMWLVGDR